MATRPAPLPLLAPIVVDYDDGDWVLRDAAGLVIGVFGSREAAVRFGAVVAPVIG